MKATVTRMMFLFLNLDLYCLPPADDVKPLLLVGVVPFSVPLCCTGRDDIILNTGAKVLLKLFVDAFEGIARYSPYGFTLLATIQRLNQSHTCVWLQNNTSNAFAESLDETCHTFLLCAVQGLRYQA